MGVFKEEAHAFETIAEKSERIYNDAADYGYPYNTKEPDAYVKRVIEAVKDLKGLDRKYPREFPLIRNREKWSNGVSITIRIAWEIDEGYYRGTEYTITVNKVNPKHPSFLHKGSGANAFMSVDVSSYKERVG